MDVREAFGSNIAAGYISLEVIEFCGTNIEAVDRTVPTSGGIYN